MRCVFRSIVLALAATMTLGAASPNWAVAQADPVSDEQLARQDPAEPTAAQPAVPREEAPQLRLKFGSAAFEDEASKEVRIGRGSRIWKNILAHTLIYYPTIFVTTLAMLAVNPESSTASIIKVGNVVSLVLGSAATHGIGRGNEGEGGFIDTMIGGFIGGMPGMVMAFASQGDGGLLMGSTLVSFVGMMLGNIIGFEQSHAGAVRERRSLMLSAMPVEDGFVATVGGRF